MISVIVGTTTQRNTVNYTPDKSLRYILEDNGIDYSTANIMLDGANIKVGDMDKTLSDLGITDKCMLIAAVKADNAR